MNPSIRILEILAPGPFSTVQDLGRPGLAALGIGRSGAADRPSLQLANALVGNDPSAAGIEMTFGRLRVRFRQDALIALTGAPCPLQIDMAHAEMDTPLPVSAGQTLKIGSPTTGLRSYLAVRGGIDVPTVLGSRATDTLSGIGPSILTAGALLPMGALLLDPGPVGSVPASAGSTSSGTGPLSMTRGPRADWFTEQALELLTDATWKVTTDADRVGVRLAGPVLQRAATRELPSEPMVAGALQVPPAGQPIVFLTDHPVTGGYPVIAVLTSGGIARAAQLRPGQPVDFRWEVDELEPGR